MKLKAIILSAGEGSRMRPLTLTKPKTMLPVAGKPIIQYNIESLRDNGITDILLIVRYKEEIVRNYFGDGSDFGVNISYKTQKDFLGTANAISYGEDFIDDSIIVLNGDIILDDEIIHEIIKKYNYLSPDTLMLLTEVEDPSAFGVVEIENGNIKNSVNFPNCDMGTCVAVGRVTIAHKNIPNMISQFTKILGSEGLNIADMTNKSRGSYAYTIIDLESAASKEALDELRAIEGVSKVRVIK